MTKSTCILIRKLLVTAAAFAAFAVLATACGSASGGGGGSSDQGSAAIAAAESNETNLVLTGSVDSTQFLDTADGSIRELADVVTGDRPVLLWYWAPH